eukprot:1160808-Pelagomonas_calceolata.AAC.2
MQQKEKGVDKHLKVQGLACTEGRELGKTRGFFNGKMDSLPILPSVVLLAMLWDGLARPFSKWCALTLSAQGASTLPQLEHATLHGETACTCKMRWVCV